MTVVVLTGAATSAEVKHALKLGARAVPSTSDGEEEILAACDAAFAGEVYLSSSMKNEPAGVSRDPLSLLPRQMAILHSLAQGIARQRSDEHTSELQSLMRNSYAVFVLKK